MKGVNANPTSNPNLLFLPLVKYHVAISSVNSDLGYFLDFVIQFLSVIARILDSKVDDIVMTTRDRERMWRFFKSFLEILTKANCPYW